MFFLQGFVGFKLLNFDLIIKIYCQCIEHTCVPFPGFSKVVFFIWRPLTSDLHLKYKITIMVMKTALGYLKAF